MNVAIVDDEIRWQEHIESEVMKSITETNITKYDSGEEFIADTKEYSIVFMDIEMGEKSGLEAGKEYLEMFPESKLIMTTSHEELIDKGFRIHAFDFVVKSRLDSIRESCKDVLKIMEQDEYIAILTDTKDYKFRVKDILYVEVFGRVVQVHLINKKIELRSSLKAFSDKLDGKGFKYSRRSIYVNLSKVRKCKSGSVTLINGEKLSLTRDRYSDFLKAYLDWNFS